MEKMYGLVETGNIYEFCAFKAAGLYRGTDCVFEVESFEGEGATHMIVRGGGEPWTSSNPRYRGTVADLALRHVAALGRDVSEDIPATLVAEIKSATVSAFEADLVAALADHDACLVRPATGNPWLFLSTAFLEQFQKGDGVKVCGETPTPHWGVNRLFARLSRGELQLTRYYQGAPFHFKGHRALEVLEEMDELAAQLQAARQYRRQYRATVSEVIFKEELELVPLVQCEACKGFGGEVLCGECQGIVEKGIAAGKTAAMYCAPPEGGFENQEDYDDAWVETAFEAERNARLFPSFRPTAKEINDREEQLDLNGELWKLYDAGVTTGVYRIVEGKDETS